MKCYERYIAKTVMTMIGIVVFLLVGLEIFMWVIGEMNDIGQGQYHFGTVIAIVLLHLPYELYQLFPVAALIGCLLGLGILASHSELTVLRASGVSVLRIGVVVTKVALLLGLVVLFIGEYIAPWCVHQAQTLKMQAIYGQKIMPNHGIWLREGGDIFHIEHAVSSDVLKGVTHFRLDDKRQLLKSEHAQHVHYENGKWYAHGILSSTIGDTIVERTNIEDAIWNMGVSPEVIAVASANPDEMSLYHLHQYVWEYYENDASGGRYEVEYWRRIIQPFATLIMMFLAIPFIFGPLRSATMGLRLVAGIAVGFAFFLLNQLLGPMSLVYDFPPLLAMSLPPLVIGGLALWMLRWSR